MRGLVERNLAGRMPLSMYGYLAGARSRNLGASHFIRGTRRTGSYLVVECSDGTLATSHAQRISRYLRGTNYALERVWRRYSGDSRLSLQGWTVVDVGANIGEFSLAAISRGAAHVLAFEPDPTCWGPLSYNLAGTKSLISPVALSNYPGVATLNVESGSADTTLAHLEPNRNALRVVTRTLDDFVDVLPLDTPLLVKMDAEGYEPEVIAGAELMLQRSMVVLVDGRPERMGSATSQVVAEELRRAGMAVSVAGHMVRAWRDPVKAAFRGLHED